MSRALLPLGPVRVGGTELSGLVTGSAVTRSSRHHITLLVNGRCVGSRPLLAAFEEGYRPLLPRGRHPMAVIVLHVPRRSVDVNVHPSKAEVRLRHEADLAAALKGAVREALGRSVTSPAADLRFALGPEQAPLPHMVLRLPKVVKKPDRARISTSSKPAFSNR